MNRLTFAVVFWTTVCSGLVAAGPATVREYERVFTTYPYSDPDPVASATRFYPYFRFDGFTDRPVSKAWKVVELANDHVQVLILPEVGGKVWAAIEKSTGRSFLYFNHVIKFRDVAMRGPWTSGGIEANYGIIGHAPTCSAPVDYLTRTNPDGSVSCFIGALDLLTRSDWRVEIRLAPDRACFETRSLWHNGSGVEQPYYTWMNVGIKSAGNLQFVNPGSHHVGHDGKASPWPIRPEDGRDLTWYERNDFGGPKSYHVVGRYSEFFGGYWHDDDYGMAHFAPFRDKPGRKIWIWGLSRDGMIWEKLLTDSDGQYVEVQSGRLFNQAAEGSAHTPFKHRAFPAYATDSWVETWLPVKGTKGFVTASPWGALNVSSEGQRLTVRICPVRPLRDKLEVFDGQKLVESRDVSLEPMRPVEVVLTLPSVPQSLRVCVGGGKLEHVAGDANLLSRPVEAPPRFDWNSAEGLYVKGMESLRQRDYAAATEAFRACVKLAPNHIPALGELAGLANRRGDHAAARELAQRALSVDTYDPAANLQFGLAAAALGRTADAKAAFSLAALAPESRAAACTELARELVREHRYDDALASLEDSLDANRRNLSAIALEACIARLQGDVAAAEKALAALLELDPLNHLARVEKYLGGRAGRDEVTRLVRNELPHETYLELAAWYCGIGRPDDAARVLELAPGTAEVLYWRAYLLRDKRLLTAAEAAPPAYVFPFRPESVAVFEWARSQSNVWQTRYDLALVRWQLGDADRAGELLTSCADEPAFGPFFAVRAQVVPAGAERDLRRADRLDPAQWRYSAMLVRHLLGRGEVSSALEVAGEALRRFPANSAIALWHVKALLATRRYREAADRLNALNLLPSEGTTEARALFHEANLWLAVEQLQAHNLEQALRFLEAARQWPEHLGSGKPYPEDLDERLEDWLAHRCYSARGTAVEAQAALERIHAAAAHTEPRGAGGLVGALALKRAGHAADADRAIQAVVGSDPSQPFARWARSVYDGKPTDLPEGVGGLECRILAAAVR